MLSFYLRQEAAMQILDKNAGIAQALTIERWKVNNAAFWISLYNAR